MGPGPMREQLLQTAMTFGSGDEAAIDKLKEDAITARDAFVTQGIFEGAKPDQNQMEIRKEVRKSIGDEIKIITKEEAAITTNFNKIRGLAEQVKRGNRTAVGQALIALVKLGDPGSTVRYEEMKGALNTQTPTASVMGVLAGTNMPKDVQESIIRSIDPLNPKSLDVEDLMKTANQLVLGSVPSIQARYSDSRSRAGDNLSQSGMRSLFTKGLENRVGGLSLLVPQPTAGEAAAPTTPPPAGQIKFLGFE
jgi:hypothetical protein